MMHRKDFLKLITVSTGTALIGGEFILNGCANPKSGDISFSTDETTLLNEVAETIIPKTSTPGAIEAKVVDYMQLIVQDCYKKEEQIVFKKGIKKLQDFCKEKIKKDFMQASPHERKAVLEELDKESKAFQNKKNKKEKAKKNEAKKNKHLLYDFEPNHYFTMIKQLTIYGYFTSKQGMTKALRYIPVPGKWLADIEYKKGDRDWARY